MKLNAEQIIKQMQEWCDNMCENACLKGESLNGKVHTCEICFPNTVKNALSLIKELTEDLHATRTELTRVQEENERLLARNFDLAEKGEKVVIAYKKLSEENDRLKKDKIVYETALGIHTMPNLLSLDDDVARLYTQIESKIKADTVRKFSERLNEAFKHYPQRCGECCKEKVDQIAKEMMEDVK